MYRSIPHMQTTYMQSFIISHSSCAKQYGDMFTDTQIHSLTHSHSPTHTIKPPWAGVQLVGHTSISIAPWRPHHHRHRAKEGECPEGTLYCVKYTWEKKSVPVRTFARRRWFLCSWTWWIDSYNSGSSQTPQTTPVPPRHSRSVVSCKKLLIYKHPSRQGTRLIEVAHICLHIVQVYEYGLLIFAYTINIVIINQLAAHELLTFG